MGVTRSPTAVSNGPYPGSEQVATNILTRLWQPKGRHLTRTPVQRVSCEDSHVGVRLGTPAALLDLRTASLSVEQPIAANERQASRMVHFGGSMGRRSRFGVSSLQD